MGITERILRLPYLNPLGVWVALSLEDGKYLVRLARKSIERYLKERRTEDVSDAPSRLMEKGGAFVTLETYPEKNLRGCIGYIMAVKPIAQAVSECAVNAAFGDMRFRAVGEAELASLVVEVSVLTPPLRVEVEEPAHYEKAIRVGRDGLIVEDGYYSGLLLPQVPVEHRWDEHEFLCQTCVKAGMPPNAWESKRTAIYRFESQVFGERKPMGEVEERKLGVSERGGEGSGIGGIADGKHGHAGMANGVANGKGD